MTQKTLDNTNEETTVKNVSDVKIVGDTNIWKLVCKASSESEGWMKSTKMMKMDGNVVICVTTQQRNPDGSYAIAEALTSFQDTSLVNFYAN